MRHQQSAPRTYRLFLLFLLLSCLIRFGRPSATAFIDQSRCGSSCFSVLVRSFQLSPPLPFRFFFISLPYIMASPSSHHHFRSVNTPDPLILGSASISGFYKSSRPYGIPLPSHHSASASRVPLTAAAASVLFDVPDFVKKTFVSHFFLNLCRFIPPTDQISLLLHK